MNITLLTTENGHSMPIRLKVKDKLNKRQVIWPSIQTSFHCVFYKSFHEKNDRCQGLIQYEVWSQCNQRFLYIRAKPINLNWLMDIDGQTNLWAKNLCTSCMVVSADVRDWQTAGALRQPPASPGCG